MNIKILNCDVMCGLSQLSNESIHCVVTSPPYWCLRDYGFDGQIGQEETPKEYIDRLVSVFREVRRILHTDGTFWLNIGDCYNAGGRVGHGTREGYKQKTNRASASGQDWRRPNDALLKPKDLIGIPWRMAFALQDDGWWLRSDVVWNKTNVMPESVKDRPTRSHEYLFLLTKSERYFYDADAIREPHSKVSIARSRRGRSDHHKWINGPGKQTIATDVNVSLHQKGRNRRTVWNIPTRSYRGAHFATFPYELPELCIKAGCPLGGTVLDPFSGSGTTLLVANRLQRNAIGIELNPDYAAMSERRINEECGGLLSL